MPRGPEAAFGRDIEQACQLGGVAYYHTFTSLHSAPGWPDYVFCLKDGRILFRELKSLTGKVTEHQAAWLRRLSDAGLDATVWRPSDWPDRVLSELGIGQGNRHRPLVGR